MQQIRIDRYVLETLMPDLIGHDKRPSAIIVYLYLWMHRSSARAWRTTLSLRDLAEGTGLSKRGVQEALRVLERRRLIARTKAVTTSIATYEVLRPWHRR